MSKVLSLKLQDAVFRDVEKITREINIPRNSYINKALAFYNRYNQRRLLKQQLSRESLMVAENSLELLHEFDMMEESLPE